MSDAVTPYALLFAPYDAVALIANSEELDLAAVQADLPANTLFVFFTRCPRVIKTPFRRDAVLFHLLNAALEINETDAVADKARALFAPGALKAEFGLRIGRGGKVLDPPDRQAAGIDHTVDCSKITNEWYTPGLAPTTGFAASLWLHALLPDKDIYLCGFSGVRGAAFTVRTMHDWTLEQSVLRLMYRRGSLIPFEKAKRQPSLHERVQMAVPGATAEEICAVTDDVLAARLTALDRLMARLVSILRLPLSIDGWLKRRG